MVEFAHFTDAELELVHAIVGRALGAGIYDDFLTCEMDIAAVSYHTPLRLADLLAADGFNFSHDLAGIQRHINRRTGLLEHLFCPRFAAHQD